MQRDLSDSTVSRNIGTGFAHSYLAIQYIMKGLFKLEPNIDKINYDLNLNYAVLAEAIQIILKKNFVLDAYDKIKKLTRNNQNFTKNEYIKLVESLEINDNDKSKLLYLTPSTYI